MSVATQEQLPKQLKIRPKPLYKHVTRRETHVTARLLLQTSEGTPCPRSEQKCALCPGRPLQESVCMHLPGMHKCVNGYIAWDPGAWRAPT